MELHENNPKRNAEYYPGLTAYQAIRNVEPQRFPFMSVVYVCSPYAGDVEENIRKACAYCRYTVDQGCIPLAPHLYLPQFLDEESERELALFAVCYGLRRPVYSFISSKCRIISVNIELH